MGIRDALRTFTRGMVYATSDALRKAVADDDEEEGGATGRAPATNGARAAPDETSGDDAVEPNEVDGETSEPGADGSSAESPDGDGDIEADDQALPTSPLALIHGDPDERVEKPPVEPADIDKPATDPQAIGWDPFAVIDALGYKERPATTSYATLRAMSFRVTPYRAAMQTRKSQCASFCYPQVDKYSPGYRVGLRDKKARASPASEARSQQIERWLQTTGVTDHPENRDDFETFVLKLVEDTLTFDAMGIEVVPARSGKPASFYAVDASTLRIADTTKIFVDPEDGDIIRYVQIYDGLVVAEFTGNMLCYGVRNPSPDIRLQGYGTSELEYLIEIVTAFLWGFDYNKRFFSQGTSQKGLINVQGIVPDRQLRNFRRHWYSTVAGVENAFKTPILNVPEGVQWMNMQSTNRDMEFNAWMDWLIKLVCSILLMDPLEINFKYGDSGGAKSQFESGNQSKLTASKDKGLKPLLRFLARKINTHLVHALDEDFEFDFVGLEAQTPNEQADLNTKLVKTTRTVDELRALEDLPPLANGLGDIILDPTYLQHMMQSAQSASGTGAFAPPPPPMAPGEEGGDDFDKLRGELGAEDGGAPVDDKGPPKMGGAPGNASGKPAGESGGGPAKPAPSMAKSQRVTIDVEV